MKKLFLALTLLSFMTTASFAQKKIKEEVKIQYKVTDVDADNMQASMMKGSTMEMFVSEKKTCTVMSIMGGMVSIKSYTDKESKEITTLMDMMAKKMKINLTAEDIEEAKKKQKSDVEEGQEQASSIEYTYDKKNTKEIAGYKCYQAKGKDANGNEMTLYITDKIDVNMGDMANQAGIDYASLEGFPMEYTIKNPMFSMTYTAQEVKADFDKDVFIINDEGYEEVDPEDLSKMGGLGF